MPSANGFFVGNNGPAYEDIEIRKGPPLDYAVEKLANSLKAVHSLICNTKLYMPDDIVVEGKMGLSLKEDFILHDAYVAFHYGLTAFLAFVNMLSLANHSLIDELAGYDDKQFSEWLDKVWSEGSVTG